MLASLIAGFLSGETARTIQQARRAAWFYAAIALLALVGTAFLILAAYIWAAERLDPIKAAAAFGTFFLAVAFTVLMVHKLTTKARNRRAARRRSVELTTVGVASAIALLPAIMRLRIGSGAIAGVLAALAAYAVYRENSVSGGEWGDGGEVPPE